MKRVRFNSLFQSTPPARGATISAAPSPTCWGNFNPRPPRGGRRPRPGRTEATGDFNPRPPRGGRRRVPIVWSNCLMISIHAPREGGDAGAVGLTPPLENFNPRPPRGGRPPAPSPSDGSPPYFNPRPPRGGRLYWDSRYGTSVVISIHAPREGGDSEGDTTCARPSDFNPRPPRGGRPPVLGRLSQGVSLFQSTPPARGATS